jgi:hypothetical protein
MNPPTFHHDFVHLNRTWRLEAIPASGRNGATWSVQIVMPGGVWESMKLYPTAEQAIAGGRAHIRRHGLKIWQGAPAR